MSNEIFPSDRVYKFLKVEEYFDRYKEWEQLGSVESHSFNGDKKTLSLKFKKANGSDCLMLIEVIQNDTLRVRFNPTKSTEAQYSSFSHLLKHRNFDEADEETRQQYIFDLDYKEDNGQIVLTTKSQYNQIVMKVVVTLAPFGINVFNNSPSNSEYAEIPVWQTADTPIYYTPHSIDPNNPEDYAIIQAVKKPSNGKYIGFGEQGGTKLSKNSDQLNYFNFDNMRYRQVYNRGPLDNREPLYHSEPFFYEFNGIPGSKNVNAVLLDNPSQVFIDIGYSNSGRYMLGTRFGDMDYYLLLGEDPKNILDSFTAIVGRAELKPRYALGYHQGCYGYECAADLKWAVEKYRQYQIPLDGLAVDVDIQENYRTFTIKPDYQTNKNAPYEQTFGSHKEMFSWLRSQGVKCSTNITPVISSQDKNNPGYYSTYKEGLEKGYFITDQRYDADNPDSKYYQLWGLYGPGTVGCPNNGWVEGDSYNSGQPYIGEVYYGPDANGQPMGSPGHYSDFARSEVREWWGKQYTYLFDQGLEFVWQDMTTPAIRQNRGDMKGLPFKLLVNSDFEGTVELKPSLKVWNLYSYNLHKATYEGLNKLPGRENTRNFIIGRGSYVGSHRYAGLWTGDNSSDWDFLQMNISQVLSLGMHALAVTGQDIGGFEEAAYDSGKWANPELLIRWTGAGAFLPWFRNHYVRKGRKEFQEPFQYVEWFNNYKGGNIPEPQDLYRMVPDICRHYITLRYRLMQLFYDALFENTLNGMPICRPLFLNDPQDESLYNDKDEFLNNEFFVRKDLLIAPVLRPQYEDNNNGRRDVYLPKGSNWYCFVDNVMPLGAATEGGTTIRDFDANINVNGDHIHFIVPIYVRAGAIIPTIEVEQYVGQLNAEGKPNPITLNVYPGEQGEYSMYLDDGVSRSSAPKADVDDPNANDEYRETKITHSYTSEKMREIKVERVHDGYTPPFEKYFFVAILHDPSEQRGATGPLRGVILQDQYLQAIKGATPEERSQHLQNATSNAWYYNDHINISFIKVFDYSPYISIQVEYV
ncbi:TIM-barrel domain-containing protein [Okeania sp. SIO2C9]|uniref:glycoside hydrolase family 31 protein n=1 Tax=Okeania sp. SIO2C9 TaxID=2607791 RepID=UPI0025D723D5|nr:TIM-barrel domain-containing protein [Okeania sp. SIO2C9]